MITNKHFRNLFLSSLSLTNKILSYLSINNSTLRNWIENEFKKTKNKVKYILRKNREKIYIFFNIWTSLNDYVLIGIVLYFIDDDYQVRTILLGIRKVYKEHSNENVDYTVVNVIYKFQIESELDVFVLDNVDNNDTVVYYILNELELHDIHEKEYCRLCCLGHIINLVIQNFIFNQNSEKWLREHVVIEESTDIEDLQYSWMS